MIICEHPQHSEEWFRARWGIPTASEFDRIITTAGELSKQSKKYLYEIIGQRLVEYQHEESYQSPAMLRGTILEPEARELYKVINNVEVEEVGLCLQDDGLYGASTDGMIPSEGSLEIKCPNLSTHIEYLIKGDLPTAYFQQIQGQMLVTGFDWVDFMSYYPGVKPFIFRVYRDDQFLNKLHETLIAFDQKVNDFLMKITSS